MTYGYVEVVAGYDNKRCDKISPWEITKAGKRSYGRGVADNKGQHTVNLASLKAFLEIWGQLDFNPLFLIETGEQQGSPGLKEFYGKIKIF